MKRFNPKIAVAVAAVGMMMASAAGVSSVAFAQGNPPPAATTPAQAQEQVEQPGAPGQPDQAEQGETPGAAGQPEANEANESDQQPEAAESAALASQARITAQQAEATALAANPGTTVVKSHLGDENGTIVYEVELSNGSDVKVDAQSGKITATDANDANESDGQTELGETVTQ